MTLYKAVEHGKEHRKNEGWRFFMHTDGCRWCMSNLRHSMIKESARTDNEIELFMNENDIYFPYRKMQRSVTAR